MLSKYQLSKKHDIYVTDAIVGLLTNCYAQLRKFTSAISGISLTKLNDTASNTSSLLLNLICYNQMSLTARYIPSFLLSETIRF